MRAGLATAQSGVALVIVLFVIFLATMAAVALTETQELAIRRTGVLQHLGQARGYASGGEAYARVVLDYDDEDKQVDHLDEPWASVELGLPIEGGTISGRIEDLQGRFNLNNLVAEDGQTADEVQLATFRRLLQSLELDPGLADAAKDWIDTDQERSGVSGAEDSTYVSKDPPYLAANRPFASPSELRLLDGMKDEDLERLLPQVVALPRGTAINVNTASVALLSALAEDMDPITAESLAERRVEDPFTAVADFLSAAQLADESVPADNLSVTTRYFEARVEVELGTARMTMYSVIFRDGERGSSVVERRFGAAG